jgi:hypothetical protein
MVGVAPATRHGRAFPLDAGRVVESGDMSMGRWARGHVRAVLARFGVAAARRARNTDPTEEVILLSSADFARIDHDEVALAVMEVLPHTKVLIIEESHFWSTEDL